MGRDTDVEEEQSPVRITFESIKSEHEVSLYVPFIKQFPQTSRIAEMFAHVSL